MPDSTRSKNAEYTPGTSDEAVRRSTGRGWHEWFQALDNAGAIDLEHKEIVSWLRDEAGLASGWWQQNVTVEYEKARGKRAPVGETSDGGFQVGVSRTVRLNAAEVWGLLLQPPGRGAWLGVIGTLPLEPGTRFETDEGTTCEIRSIRPGERLRLTWQPKDWSRPSTLQIHLGDKGDRCTIGIHQERLADASARQEMREHWRKVLDVLQSLATDESR